MLAVLVAIQTGIKSICLIGTSTAKNKTSWNANEMP